MKADAIKRLREKMGMARPDFGRLINMDSSGVVNREFHRCPWTSDQRERLLKAIISHLDEVKREAYSVLDIPF